MFLFLFLGSFLFPFYFLSSPAPGLLCFTFPFSLFSSFSCFLSFFSFLFPFYFLFTPCTGYRLVIKHGKGKSLMNVNYILWMFQLPQHTSTTKWMQIQKGGPNPSCLYKKILAGNLYCSPSPPHFVAEIWRRMFLHVVFRWAYSLATKWLSIFKGLSTTETLKTYKMQFPSCGYKMPGPSPFAHLILSPEMPLKRGTRPPIL